MDAASNVVNTLVILVLVNLVYAGSDNSSSSSSSSNNNISSASFTCLKHECDVSRGRITCEGGLILVTDVTDRLLNRSTAALQKWKQECTGRSQCGPCRSRGGKLVVHYYCVATYPSLSRDVYASCAKHNPDIITSDFGYIQSPGYPLSVNRNVTPCKWQFKLDPGKRVVLILHHITTRNTQAKCTGGLMVTGRACDEEGHAYAPRLLCGPPRGGVARGVVQMERCGQVDIELTSNAPQVYPLRFWISFQVRKVRLPSSQYQPANYQSDTLPCLGWMHSDGGRYYNQSRSDTQIIPEAVTTESEPNLQFLVIMLSVISGISAVLLILLIVVCVRCRLLRSPYYSDHIYSEPTSPTPSNTAHLELMKSLDTDPPKLSDEYFDVADALPISLRKDTPASPVYTEVEQFSPLRKGPWSSQRGKGGDSSKPSSGPDGGERASLPCHVEVIEVGTHKKQRKYKGGKYKNNYTNVPVGEASSPESPKDGDQEKRPRRGMLGRLVGDRSRTSAKDKGTNQSPSASPKSRFLNRKSSKLKDKSLPEKPRLELVASSHVLTSSNDETFIKPAVVCEEEDTALYEPVVVESEYEPIKFQHETVDSKKNGRLSVEAKSSVALLSYNKSENGKGHYEDMFDKPLTVRLNMIEDEAHLSKLSKNNNTKKNLNSSLRRDLPKTRGIVKSGIKKYEEAAGIS